ncbi:murein biosynthesis integral membrane protein MurJ [Hanstruepera neustonica]|uniref:murein biosynthesis integral membrane protein MurJ n=1 Tax=Hanstruepera neustonica TaxID=1445657 RepID=UPI001FAF6493|nr:lipid II flippase MurJ [Hanstruepera neustonica]
MINFNDIKSIIQKTFKSSLVVNITTVALITILVKGFGFYKEVVVASNIGLSELLDTFFIALLLPGFINQVFLIAFKSVFIPNYVAELKGGDNTGTVQSTSFLITLGAGLVFTLVAFLFTDVFLETFFNGHSEDYYQLVKTQFYYLAPCIVIWGFCALLEGMLNIYNEFKFASIHPILTSISMLVCLLIFKEELQEKVLAVGMLIGSSLELLLLIIVCLRKQIINLKKVDFQNKNVKMMFNQLPARVSSGFLTGLIPVTDQYFAATLAVGSIAALNYGMKIPAFFSSIIVMALGSVLLPYFSNLNYDNRELAFKKLMTILKVLFISLIIIVIPLIIFSTPIIAILFERNAFKADDTILVANIQMIFLISIPFTICGDAIVRFLTSINKNAFLAYVSFGTMIFNFILDYIFMQYYGILGIAICTTVVQILKVLIFIQYARKQQQLPIT